MGDCVGQRHDVARVDARRGLGERLRPAGVIGRVGQLRSLAAGREPARLPTVHRVVARTEPATRAGEDADECWVRGGVGENLENGDDLSGDSHLQETTAADQLYRYAP